MNLSEFTRVPVIDAAPLVQRAEERSRTVEQIGLACQESGLFCVVGHRGAESLCCRPEAASRRLFR